MILEDHVGDIVRKARQAANVSLADAAAKAGLSYSDFSKLEESGDLQIMPDYNALAHLIGLNPAKLRPIVDGWRPAPVDLSLWREVRQLTTIQRMAVNCYLVWDVETREAALFDTGWKIDPIDQVISENQLHLQHLFLTHSHEDHIAALGPIRAKFPKIRMHSSSKNAPPEQRNRQDDSIHLGSLRISNRETPGHAEDGATYVIAGFPNAAPDIAVVGDCIFAGSIGKGFISTDLLKQKIREEIFSLPDATLILPGHGPCTTVGEERRNNPFF